MRRITVKMVYTCLLGAVLTAVLSMPGLGHAESRLVTLPMSIDYALLNALVRNSFFEGGPGAGVDREKTRKTLHSAQDGCQGVVVSAPRFREQDRELLMETQVHLRHGRSMGRFCVLPLTFDGILVMRQTPSISAEDWTLRFTPTASEMRTQDGQPARLASLAWRLVEEHVLDSLTEVSVNLGLPKQELNDVLPLMLPTGHSQQVLEMLRDLRPGDILIQDQGLRLETLLTTFEELYHPEPEPLEPYLSDEKLELFITSWEAWDAFLVYLITTLASRPLEDDEQLLLLDVLLRLRHEFSHQLDDPADLTALVRNQFVDAWTWLGPLFRRHLLDADNESLLGYLAFFSASDALLALDKLGPTLGLEISRDGLIRLARLLGDQEVLLEYGPELLPELRRILGLEKDITSQEADPAASPWSRRLEILSERVASLLVQTAWAEFPPADLKNDLRKWLFQGRNLEQYMNRVTKVLKKRADAVLAETEQKTDLHDFFHDLVLATAWQESCFRQFIESGGRITYIRSSNNTSVGIMQINERVWRGLYDQTRLRWDITYNAQAGAEILDLYYSKYARPRMARTPVMGWSVDLQAGMLYAMYNGGPGQLERFLTRSKENALQRSDRLFQEKWGWVRDDALDKIGICLGGR